MGTKKEKKKKKKKKKKTPSLATSGKVERIVVGL